MKNKFLAILLSVVVAFGLWLYVITVVNPEFEKTYYEIPVVLQNKEILTERGLMIVSDVPKVTLALKGNRTTLNDLNEANINVITNVGNIEKPGTHNLSYDIQYPGNVSQNEISVLSSSTDLITVKVETRVKKILPVVIDYGATAVPEGFLADLTNIQLDNPSVEVVGPASVMENIHKAVVSVDLTNKTETIVGEYQYALCNAEGEPVDAEMVTTNVEDIGLVLKIQRVKEIDLVVDIIAGGGATAQTSTIELDIEKIRVSGSEQLLEGLDSLTVGAINLGQIREDKVITFPITLPEGITNQTGVEQVNVSVRFPKLMMKTFNVSTITAINIPAGMDVDMITKMLTVEVRGPIELVEDITEADISVVVDFAGAQMGIATMKADIVIGSKYAGVGAMGTYQVSAELKSSES